MNNMFIPYEESLVLKELGFYEPCIAYYNGKFLDFKIWDDDGVICPIIYPDMNIGECISAPLYQDVFNWFIEKHKLEGVVISWKQRGEIVWYYSAEGVGVPHRYKCYECCVKTKREAELACINKLIELVKNTKDGE